MRNYVSRSNIDKYLNLLQDGAPSHQTLTIRKLLIEEEDKLGHDLEQLEFALARTAACRDRVERQRQLKDGLPDGTILRNQADSLLINSEHLLHLMEGFCEQLQTKLNRSQF